MVLDLLSGERREPAECLVTVDGEEIVDLYPFLVELTVDAARDRAAAATLRFESRRDENGVWTVQDAGILAPWKTIVIEAAFGSDTEEVMRGYIREVSADYPQEPGNTTVTVECQDESLLLDRGHVRKAWGADTPTDDATIARTIVSDHGLSLDSESGPGLSGLVLNQNGTDIAFLRERARANGYELIFREGEVYFGPLRLGSEPQATILVYAGRDTHCFSFSTRSDGHQPDQVAFDVAAEEGAESVERVVSPDLELLGNEAADSTSAGLGDFIWRLDRQGIANEEQLAALAQARANELSLRVKAEGELDGSRYGHVLRVGEPVGVDGVGDWLGGRYYVDTVSHRFSMDGYRQSFQLLRNAYGDDLAAGGGLLDAVL